ncbi:MAG TPA: nitrilase-related carbon-nitrogen hydrolase, partial [Rickettsiales bacterium]|nr:nitrilase-related carbon-nitrogen hydrolase [Rickettsiales bacterium]
MKIYLAQINTKIGDFQGNYEKILREFKKAQERNCDLVIFPEMTLTGYDARDLWLRSAFIDESNSYLTKIIEATKSCKCAILVGAPYVEKNKKYNAVLLVENGEIVSVVRKKILPNFSVFDEKRYFVSSDILSYIKFRDKTLSLLICEDMWHATNHYLMQEQIFDFVVVVNASPFENDKLQKRLEMARNLVAKVAKPLIYVNQIGGQDCLVFDGNSFVLDEKGQEVLMLKGFEEDSAIIDVGAHHMRLHRDFASGAGACDAPLRSLYQACVLGLRDYIHKTNHQKILLGMSGGIDSALVAAIAVDALGRENVALYALPSRYNSNESMNDALVT